MLKSAILVMTSVFPPLILERGNEYQKKGHVLNVRLSDGLLKARVKGSTSQIYDVHIDLKVWPKFKARCNCKYSINCKHAAASLFELEAREHGTKDAPQSSNNYESYSVHKDLYNEEILNADDVEWYSDINSSTNDFFSYQLGILIDDITVSIVPLVVD